MNTWRTFAVAPLVALGIFLTACSQNQGDNKSQSIFLDKSQVKKVQPTVEPFEINGIKAPADASQLPAYINALNGKIKRQSSTGVPYQDIILYSWIACQADWNVDCEGDYPSSQNPLPLMAPPWEADVQDASYDNERKQ